MLNGKLFIAIIAALIVGMLFVVTQYEWSLGLVLPRETCIDPAVNYSLPQFKHINDPKCVWGPGEIRPRTPFVPPPAYCGEYVLPEMPQDVKDLKFGIDIPALLPPDQHTPNLLWDTHGIRFLIRDHELWEKDYEKMCDIPQEYSLMLDVLMSSDDLIPTNWRELHHNKVPCEFFTESMDSFHVSDKRCPQCTMSDFRKRGSLAWLKKAPSVIINGQIFLPPKFLWIMQRYRTEKTLWVLELTTECLEYYPMASYPFYKAITNISVGYDRNNFEVPLLTNWMVWEPKFHELEPIPTFEQRNFSAPVFWLQSNCNSYSHREYLVKELLKYMDIDIYGDCFPNKQLPDWLKDKDPKKSYNTKIELMRNYPFVLSLENSIVNDWITEKWYHPLIYGSVPLYLGPDSVVDFYPVEYNPDYPVMINLRDWESMENLALYLKALMVNETMYNRYHKWRTVPWEEKYEKAKLWKWYYDQASKLDPLICGYCRHIEQGKEAAGWNTSYANSEVYKREENHPYVTVHKLYEQDGFKKWKRGH